MFYVGVEWNVADWSSISNEKRLIHWNKLGYNCCDILSLVPMIDAWAPSRWFSFMMASLVHLGSVSFFSKSHEDSFNRV